MGQNLPMKENFALLKQRVIDTLNQTKLNKKIEKIKGSTICVGSGGSNVVASFASLVLNKKNQCPTIVLEPRDVLYQNLNNYKNIFVCSYSGNNHGVNVLKDMKLNKYLLTYGDNEGFNTLKCNSLIEKERSFISLAATLMPMSILLSYYINCDSFIENIFDKYSKKRFHVKNPNLDFEILSGYDTLTPERFLETTFTESGLSNVIVHKKYDFCHGRSTLSFKNRKNLIYLLGNKKELDDMLLKELKEKYDSIIILKSNHHDLILDNYDLTIQAMYLSKYLARKKKIDLSLVEYDKPLCKKLYKYTGEM